ncbi:MAG TPA: hypothetical protein VGD45_08550 [Steroidobacter sp.]|uniref:hypothetical protein n=1 Tax=Steroidobacter sp. TaxID=1978227 RepID=UPI002EDB119F
MSKLADVLQEAKLSPEEVDQILRICGELALLVGGQALATWALYYDVEPAGVLARAITMDADFIGGKDVARALQQKLGEPWKIREGTLDDAGGQVAKVYAAIPSQGVKQIDFLSGIVGLDTDRVRARATQLVLEDGSRVHVLHPLDLLESRLANLATLPSKQNAVGVAQARLAIDVVRAFIESHMAEGGDPRIVRQVLKRIEKMALDTRLAQAAFKYDIDVLAAVPVKRIADARFHEEHWPRILRRLASKREKFEQIQTRRTALRAEKK